MNRSDENVLKQIDQLKDVRPTEQSTQRAVEQVREMFTESHRDSDARLPRGRSAHRRNSRWHVAVGSCIAVVITAIVWVTLIGQGTVAFAQVQERIKEARTVKYNFVLNGNVRGKTRCVISGLRSRYDSEATTVIRVPAKKMTLHLDHVKRTAEFHHDAATQRRTTDMYERLRDIAARSVKDLGERRVDGVQAIGFEVPEVGNDQAVTVWVDPKSHLPMKIVASGGRVQQDFEFNVDVPESTFDLSVPEGYFVENRFEEPQTPVTLEKRESDRYADIVADPNRTARQTVEAFLKLSAAGQTDLVRKLEREAFPDSLRELDGFEQLQIETFWQTDQSALAITNAAIAYRGKKRALVLTLEPRAGEWLVDDIDLESAEGVKGEVERFRRDYPDAKSK